ncbi:MAG: hypothetical protein AABN34_19615 [Acidobacteriota bacterium]
MTHCSDMSSDDKAMVSAIEAASVEIDRAIERMRNDQAEIDQLKERHAQC